MRVLIAEDSATSRWVLRATVEALGHECIEARDGAVERGGPRHDAASPPTRARTG